MPPGGLCRLGACKHPQMLGQSVSQTIQALLLFPVRQLVFSQCLLCPLCYDFFFVSNSIDGFLAHSPKEHNSPLSVHDCSPMKILLVGVAVYCNGTLDRRLSFYLTNVQDGAAAATKCNHHMCLLQQAVSGRTRCRHFLYTASPSYLRGLRAQRYGLVQESRATSITRRHRQCLLQMNTTEIADPVEELLKGRVRTVEYSNGNVVVDAPRSGKVYMAGSFNPLHEGHRGMLAAALRLCRDRKGEQAVESQHPSR